VNAYLDFYRGKTLLLKVSGKEISGASFGKLVEDITYLVANQIRILLVFGGGDQIDSAWKQKHPEEDRPKHQGVGITSPQVMEDGVLPAYAAIRSKLEAALPGIFIVSPEEVRAKKITDIGDGVSPGLVGRVEAINSPEDKPLTAVGFLGIDESGQKLNLNADDIVAHLAEQMGAKINEVIFLTESGGLLTHAGGEIISQLSLDEVDEVIAGRHPTIKVDGGMLKKLREIRKILPKVGKAVVTNARGLRREIEDKGGSGTLFFAPSAVSLSEAAIDEDKP
jgi:acetylglutamate kinase